MKASNCLCSGPQITEASARGKETGGLELNTTSTDLNLPTATSEQPLRQPFHLDFRSDSDSNNIINPVAASSSNKLFINISELKVSGWQPSTFKQMAQKSDRNTNSSRTDFVLGSTWRTSNFNLKKALRLSNVDRDRGKR